MNGSDIRTKDDGRDYRVPPTAALAAYRTWLAEHEAAWLAGAAPVPFGDRALDQLSQCAEWVLEDLGCAGAAGGWLILLVTSTPRPRRAQGPDLRRRGGAHLQYR